MRRLPPVLIGAVGGVLAALPRILHARFPIWPWSSLWAAGCLIFVGALVRASFIYRRGQQASSKSPGSVGSLFLPVHAPNRPDHASSWGIRGVLSALLAIFGCGVGEEGGAIEGSKSASLLRRTRSSRWSEQQRRTDASVSLAAGISGAFGAPFAAILLPLEMGLGGEVLSAVAAALSSFICVQFLGAIFPLEVADLRGPTFGFHFMTSREWLTTAGIGVAMGVAGPVCVQILRRLSEGFGHLMPSRFSWASVFVSALALLLLLAANPNVQGLPSDLLEAVLWVRKSQSEALVLCFSLLLAAALAIATFGTTGLFWPVFAIGGIAGFLIDQVVTQTVPGFSAVAGLMGGAALWGVVFGAPIAGSVLVLELTQNFNVLLPCVLAAAVARQVSIWLRCKPIQVWQMQEHGLQLVGGRSKSVLVTIRVRDAMITDHECIPEHETVADLYQRLLSSRYPFLPVVNSQGRYSGLLTIDMIDEAWRSQDPLTSNSPLAKLLEAKDLLYRTGVKPPVLTADETLDRSVSSFDGFPCLPVVDSAGKVEGLLFVHNVRLAYDREVARQAPAGTSAV